MKLIKSDKEFNFEYVDELCDRAIEDMNGDEDAMFFNSHLNGNGFVVKGKYVDKFDESGNSDDPDKLWQDICKSLAMEKLGRMTKGVERKNYQLAVDWVNDITSHRAIKSSIESEELAYDTANIVYKRVGPTYDKWWMKEGYGQNYAWVVAEHSDYSVRLFFEFMDTGFCYVKVHFTNGASYEDLIADSWNYARESPEYPFEETCDHVRNFLDNFFEVGGGMDKLRAKYEKGNNMYDVDSYIERDGYVKNSRKSSHGAIKSSEESMSGEDIVKGIKKTIRRNQKPMLGIKYNVLDQNGGVIGTPMSYEDACDLADDIDGEVVPVDSSRRPIKSSMYDVIIKDLDTNEVLVDDGPWYSYDDANDFGKQKIKEFESEGRNVIKEIKGYHSIDVHSSRRPVESSYIVGKQINNSIMLYCDDNCYHDEHDMCKPSIKIFNSKSDADKIAKRSKTCFVRQL